MSRLATSSRNKESELMRYFSTYLKDMVNSIQQVKKMVYELIAINCPLKKYQSVSPEIHSIVFTCNKTYEDLRKVEVLLRGYLKGNKNSHQKKEDEEKFQHKFKKNQTYFKQLAIKTNSTHESFNFLESVHKKIEQKDDILEYSSTQKNTGVDSHSVQQAQLQTAMAPDFKKMNNSRSEGNFLGLQSKKMKTEATTIESTELSSLEIIRRLRAQLLDN